MMEFGSDSEESTKFLKNNPKLLKFLRENREQIKADCDVGIIGLQYIKLKLDVSEDLAEQSELDKFKKQHPNAELQADIFRNSLKEAFEKIDDETIH